ncbi:MAG: superoxide dismutase [Pseudomonadota bacterium]
MEFKLPPLPYADNALEPVISKRTIDHHYGKHHQAYMTKLDAALSGADRDKDLETIIKESYGKTPGVFNNAAQVWNHTFYWNSLTPDFEELKDEKLLGLINAAFGSMDSLKEKFAAAGVGQFGSGWAWLVYDKGADAVSLVSTPNAECPLHMGKTALLTIDVWEHAYYLDHQQDRPGYMDKIIDGMLNWQFAVDNLNNA